MRVDGRRADARVAHPMLDKVEGDTRLQCADTKPVAKTARTGSAA
jgi:hypothetical protein